MERFYGKLSSGDQLLATVAGRIHRETGPIQGWSGLFGVPKERPAPPISVGGTYRLDIEDGLSLNVLVDRKEGNLPAGPYLVHFKSQGGPLA